MYTWQTVAGPPDNGCRVADETLLERELALAFADRLVELRKQAGLTQEKAAERAGVSRNHYQLWESGLSDRKKKSPANPTLLNLYELAEAFGVDITDVVAGLPRPRRATAAR